MVAGARIFSRPLRARCQHRNLASSRERPESAYANAAKAFDQEDDIAAPTVRRLAQTKAA